MMAETRRWRFGLVALFGLLPSVILIWQGVVDRSFTVAQIASGAPEDLLGVGPWLLLVPVGAVAVVALFWTWRRAAQGVTRVIAAAETALFVAAVVFALWSDTLLKARVFR